MEIFFQSHFFINEYWILIPTAILVNCIIINKIRSKKKIRELKDLQHKIQRTKKINKIGLLARGFGKMSKIAIRGGQLVDVSDITCGIEEGLRFLDNDNFKLIIHKLYRNKRKGKLIYITATALCHLIHNHHKMVLAMPFNIGNFGLTNLYQTARKITVTILLGAVGPLYVLGGPVTLILVCLLATLGLRLAFNDMDQIITSPALTIPRIQTKNDVVILNYQNRIIMKDSKQERLECWLADQALFNSKCNKTPTAVEINDAINSVTHNLNYDDVVNMKDVTTFDRIDFSDVLDLGLDPKQVRTRAKTVNFIDKFGDPDSIDEKHAWYSSFTGLILTFQRVFGIEIYVLDVLGRIIP